MKTIVFFLEGKSEMIFIREVLLKIFPTNVKISVQRVGINEGFEDVYRSYEVVYPNPKFHFVLYDVANDIRVLSVMINNAPNMLSKGFYVFGLRDMFSSVYDEQSSGKINDAITKKTIKLISDALKNIYTASDNRLRMFFSVMEIEAWYLGFTKSLSQMGIDIEKVKQDLNIDLLNIDPEKTFFKPKSKLKSIFEKMISKKFDEVKFSSGLCKHLTKEEIEEIVNSGKNSYFGILFNSLIGL